MRLKPMLDEAELHNLYCRAHNASAYFQQPFIEQHQAGDVLSRYRGTGMEYEESRGYQAGDEPRFINWRVTAKTGEMQVKQFREETRPGVFILLDHRHRMRFGTRLRLKAAQASRLMALISFSAMQQGWEVSALRLDDKTHWFPTSADEQSIWQFIRESSGVCPVNNNSDEPALSVVLPQIQNQLVRGNHVYLVSDFADILTVKTSADDISPHLLALVNSHPVFALHVLDPVEKHLPAAGKLVLQGMDGGAARRVNLSDPVLQEQFAEQASTRQTAIQKRLQGCHYVEIMTDLDNPETTVPLPHGLGT